MGSTVNTRVLSHVRELATQDSFFPPNRTFVTHVCFTAGKATYERKFTPQEKKRNRSLKDVG